MKGKTLYIITVLLLIHSCRDEEYITSDDCNISSYNATIELTSPLSVILNDTSENIVTSLDVQANDKANISASWNSITSWKLKITGDSSNVFVTFNGCGNSMAVNWDGINKEYSPFLNETCTVQLTFPENDSDIEYTETLTISNTIDYSDQGILCHTLDDNNLLKNLLVRWNGNTRGVNSWAEHDTVWGGHYTKFNFEITSDFDTRRSRTNVLFLVLLANREDLFGNFYPITEENLDNIYLNFFVYSESNNTFIKPQINESNDDVVNTSSYEERYILTNPNKYKSINWRNKWKLVSFKLSDFEFLRSSVVGPFNDIPNPDRIMSIHIEWWLNNRSFAIGDEMSIGIDHVMFTYGAPLQLNP